MMLDWFYFYQVVNGYGFFYDLFKVIIVLCLIGWIVFKSLNGVVNLVFYSFFNVFNNVLFIIGFVSVGYKDSVKNIEEIGEFCWSMVIQLLVEVMNNISKLVVEDVSEFELVGFEQGVFYQVNVFFVVVSLVMMECKLM